jgi:hypothetical protein
MNNLFSISSVFDIGITVALIGTGIVALNIITFIMFNKVFLDRRLRAISVRVLLTGIIISVLGFIICIYGLLV